MSKEEELGGRRGIIPRCNWSSSSAWANLACRDHLAVTSYEPVSLSTLAAPKHLLEVIVRHRDDVRTLFRELLGEADVPAPAVFFLASAVAAVAPALL